MLLFVAGNNMHNAATLGDAAAPAPAAEETRSSNPMLAHAGRLMVRCLPFLLLVVI